MPSFWQRGEDYAKEVSSELIEQIKEGVAPWQKPWKPGEQCTPENFSTGKSYTGGNSLYLMSRSIRQGHGDNRWGTYRQITAAGGQVRKGQKGTQVLFFTDRTRKTEKDEQGKPVKDKDGKQVYQGERRSCPVVRQYTVFNVEQADGFGVEAARGATDTRMANASRSGACDSSQRDDGTARRRKSGLLSARRGQGCAAGTRTICHGQRLLPDGAARTGSRQRPRQPLESENAARRYCGGLRERSLRTRRTAGGDQRHDDGPTSRRRT